MNANRLVNASMAAVVAGVFSGPAVLRSETNPEFYKLAAIELLDGNRQPESLASSHIARALCSQPRGI